jgi:hypothetical protein
VTFNLGTPPASPTQRRTLKKGVLKKNPASHDAKSLLQQRPYLKKFAPPSPSNTPTPNIPPKTTSHEDAVTWGKKLGSIDDGVMDKLAQQAQRIAEQTPACTTEDAKVLAYVQSALDTSQNVQPNMFAPFVIPSDATVGDMATVHWGNVDTGAMVNVVYLGVTRVFQYL